MTKTFNLLTGEVMDFDRNTLPIYAVTYGYCTENNLTSEMFKHCHDNTLDSFYKTLPIVTGKVSISCGDWAAKLVTV